MSASVGACVIGTPHYFARWSARVPRYHQFIVPKHNTPSPSIHQSSAHINHNRSTTSHRIIHSIIIYFPTSISIFSCRCYHHCSISSPTKPLLKRTLYASQTHPHTSLPQVTPFTHIITSSKLPDSHDGANFDVHCHPIVGFYSIQV